MTNSATLRYTVNERPTLPSKIFGYEVALTATGTDLVVRTPDSDKSVYLKGVVGAETNATNLTFKQRSPNLTGTVATTATSTTITGTGTAFTTTYVVGDEIVIESGDTLTISVITDDTHMTASGAAANTVSGKHHQKQQTLVTPMYAANQGIWDKVLHDAWIMATATGYALVLNASVAIHTLLVHVQEGAP